MLFVYRQTCRICTDGMIRTPHVHDDWNTTVTVVLDYAERAVIAHIRSEKHDSTQCALCLKDRDITKAASAAFIRGTYHGNTIMED